MTYNKNEIKQPRVASMDEMLKASKMVPKTLDVSPIPPPAQLFRFSQQPRASLSQLSPLISSSPPPAAPPVRSPQFNMPVPHAYQLPSRPYQLRPNFQPQPPLYMGAPVQQASAYQPALFAIPVAQTLAFEDQPHVTIDYDSQSSSLSPPEFTQSMPAYQPSPTVRQHPVTSSTTQPTPAAHTPPPASRPTPPPPPQSTVQIKSTPPVSSQSPTIPSVPTTSTLPEQPKPRFKYQPKKQSQNQNPQPKPTPTVKKMVVNTSAETTPNNPAMDKNKANKGKNKKRIKEREKQIKEELEKKRKAAAKLSEQNKKEKKKKKVELTKAQRAAYKKQRQQEQAKLKDMDENEKIAIAQKREQIQQENTDLIGGSQPLSGDNDKKNKPLIAEISPRENQNSSPSIGESKDINYSLPLLQAAASDIVNIDLTGFLKEEKKHETLSVNENFIKTTENALARLCAFTQMVQILAKPEFKLFIDCLLKYQPLFKQVLLQCKLFLDHVNGEYAQEKVEEWLKECKAYKQLQALPKIPPEFNEKYLEFQTRLQEFQEHKADVYRAKRLFKFVGVNDLPEEMGFLKKFIIECLVNQSKLVGRIQRGVNYIETELNKLDIQIDEELPDTISTPVLAVPYDENARLSANIGYDLVVARTKWQACMDGLDNYRNYLEGEFVFLQPKDKKFTQSALQQLKKHKEDIAKCEQEIIPIIAAIKQQDERLKYNKENENLVLEFKLAPLLLNMELMTDQDECREFTYSAWCKTLENHLDLLLTQSLKEAKPQIQWALATLNEQLKYADFLLEKSISTRINCWKLLNFYSELLKEHEDMRNKITQYAQQLNNNKQLSDSQGLSKPALNLKKTRDALQDYDSKVTSNDQYVGRLKYYSPGTIKDFKLLAARVIRYHRKAHEVIEELKRQVSSLLQQAEQLSLNSNQSPQQVDKKNTPLAASSQGSENQSSSTTQATEATSNETKEDKKNKLPLAYSSRISFGSTPSVLPKVSPPVLLDPKLRRLR